MASAPNGVAGLPRAVMTQASSRAQRAMGRSGTPSPTAETSKAVVTRAVVTRTGGT